MESMRSCTVRTPQPSIQPDTAHFRVELRLERLIQRQQDPKIRPAQLPPQCSDNRFFGKCPANWIMVRRFSSVYPRPDSASGCTVVSGSMVTSSNWTLGRFPHPLSQGTLRPLQLPRYGKMQRGQGTREAALGRQIGHFKDGGQHRIALEKAKLIHVKSPRSRPESSLE
jgi:hypothetical protein